MICRYRLARRRSGDGEGSFRRDVVYGTNAASQEGFQVLHVCSQVCSTAVSASGYNEFLIWPYRKIGDGHVSSSQSEWQEE